MKAYIEVELDVESIIEDAKDYSGDDEEISVIDACLNFGDQFADWATGTSMTVKRWVVEDGDSIAQIKF